MPHSPTEGIPDALFGSSQQLPSTHSYIWNVAPGTSKGTKMDKSVERQDYIAKAKQAEMIAAETSDMVMRYFWRRAASDYRRLASFLASRSAFNAAWRRNFPAARDNKPDNGTTAAATDRNAPK